MTAIPFDDPLALFAMMKQQLYAAVLCDALDQAGYRNQAMRADIRPVVDDAVVVGRALTMQSVDVYEFEESDYELEIAAVDSLQPGDVMVASTQQSTRTSLWGELLSTAAVARGANGAVIDGYTRDTRPIRAMGFPVFATGMHPVDSAGRSSVISYNRPVNCGGVIVNPGDIVFGDLDGVVVIPGPAAQEVIERAVAKVASENTTRDALRQGATLREVFDRYGVL